MNYSAKLWKQPYYWHRHVHQPSSNQTFIQFMRTSLIVLILLLTTFQLLLATTSKGQDMQKEKIQIAVSPVSLSQALRDIERQSSFRFYYRKSEIRTIRNLQLPVGSRTVEQTLHTLLMHTPLSFRQVGGNILIEQKKGAGFEIHGRIVDLNRNGIAFAKVSLKRADEDHLTDAAQTDSAGNFKFLVVKKGDYTIFVTAMGMDSLSLRLSLSDSLVVHLPDIIFAPKATQLKQVTVVGKKPMIERKIDRLVFNLGSSIAAKGTDLTQALALTPMLRVDQNGISIIGKSGVAVMINEKIVNISGTDLINYLRSLRSDDIEKIEVITTPPSKYEAQGNSGLINIVLKGNPNMGWSGSTTITYAKTTFSSYAGNLSLNYQSKRLSSSLKLRQYHTASRPTEEIGIVGLNSILNQDIRKDLVSGIGGNLSTDYKLNEKSNIGLIYDIGKLNYGITIDGISAYQTNSLTDSVLRTSTTQKNPGLTQTLNVYHDLKIGKLGKRLNSGFNLFSTLPENNTSFSTQSDQQLNATLVRNNSKLDFNIWSLQSDLTLPYTLFIVETGAKFTNFKNDSEVGYYNFNQQQYLIDPLKSNQFNYDEKNIAAYLSMQRDFGKRWSAKAGLRYEYAIVEGYSPTNNAYNSNEYGKLFPTAYLTYKPNQNHTISFNYAKRINRPNFRALNPFRWYTNPYVYSTGNPLLEPSFNHNLELSYLFKGKLSLTLYRHKLVNGYGRLTFVGSDLIKVVDYRNFLSQYSSGVEASISHSFYPWWENREFISLNFTNSKSSLPEVQLKDGSAFYYSTYNNFTLNKSISLFLNFWHSLPSTQGNTYSRGRSLLSSGLRFAMDNNRFQLNLSADDIFKTAVTKGETYYQQYVQTFNNYYDARRVSLSLSYTFGKDKVKGNRKQVNFKETQRAN
jgi:outer membrane receptor protein involved in Fe transport